MSDALKKQRPPTGTDTQAYVANSTAQVYLSFRRESLEMMGSMAPKSEFQTSLFAAERIDLKNSLISLEVNFGFASNSKQYAMRLVNPTEEFEASMFAYLDRVYPTKKGLISNYNRAVIKSNTRHDTTGGTPPSQQKQGGNVTKLPNPNPNATNAPWTFGATRAELLRMQNVPTLPYMYVRWGYGENESEGLSQIHKVVLVAGSLTVNANQDKLLDLSFADQFSFTKGSSTFNRRYHHVVANVTDPPLDNNPKSLAIEEPFRLPSDILSDLITNYVGAYPQIVGITDLSDYANSIDSAFYQVAKAIAEGDSLQKVQSKVRLTEGLVVGPAQQITFTTASLDVDNVRKLEEVLNAPLEDDGPSYNNMVKSGKITRNILGQAYGLIFKELGLSYEDGTTLMAQWQQGSLTQWQDKMTSPDPNVSHAGHDHGQGNRECANSVDFYKEEVIDIPRDVLKDIPRPAGVGYPALGFKPLMLTSTLVPPADIDPVVGRIGSLRTFSWSSNIGQRWGDGTLGDVSGDPYFSSTPDDHFQENEYGIIIDFRNLREAQTFDTPNLPDGSLMMSQIAGLVGSQVAESFFNGGSFSLRQFSTAFPKQYYLCDENHMPVKWPIVEYGGWCYPSHNPWIGEECPAVDFFVEDWAGKVTFQPELSPPQGLDTTMVVPITDEEWAKCKDANWGPIWLYPGIVNPDRVSKGDTIPQDATDMNRLVDSCSLDQLNTQLNWGWNGAVADSSDTGDNVMLVEIPTPGPYYRTGDEFPETPLFVTTVGDGSPERNMFATDSGAFTQEEIRETRLGIADANAPKWISHIDPSNSYFPIWNPGITNPGNPTASVGLVKLSQLDTLLSGSNAYEFLKAYKESVLSEPFFNHNRPPRSTFLHLEPTPDTIKIIREKSNNYAANFYEIMDAKAAPPGLPTGHVNTGPDPQPPPETRVRPARPSAIRVTLGADGELPHISNGLETLVNGLNRLITGKPNKLLFVAIDLGIATPSQLNSLRTGICAGIDASLWSKYEVIKPTFVVITDTKRLGSEWGKPMMNPVLSFPEITTLDKKDNIIPGWLFLEYGTPDSIIGDLKFNSNSRFIFNILQSHYAVRQSHDFSTLFDPASPLSPSIIYEVISAGLTRDMANIRDQAYAGPRGATELRLLESKMRTINNLLNPQGEALQVIDQNVLEMFPDYLASYEAAELKDIIGENSVDQAMILASVIQDPVLINLIFPEAEIDGRSNVARVDNWVWDPKRGELTRRSTIPRILQRLVNFDESTLRSAVQQLKFVDNRATFANAMGSQMWDVELTLLGIPELDNPMVEFTQRRIVLQVYDGKPRSGAMHWLSGVYLIRGINHRLNAKLGYLTQLRLYKDPRVGLPPDEMWAHKPNAATSTK